MRKSILFGLLSLVAVLAVACGSGNDANGGGNGAGGNGAACSGGENGGGDSADAYALYKKEGRKWKHKSVTKMEGMDDMVSFMEYEITKVADDHAMQKMTMLDKDGKPMAGMDPTETKIEFKTAEAPACTGGEAVEMKEETVKVAAGEFECYVTEVAGTKSYSSKKYPGLLVKMEGASNSMELIEFTE
ncbi:MAG: hypothetical protein KDB68_15380 [Planctomycetes bacterium]|nr:hypothetical protein [Planctomycetota bacterium]MCA8937578.1 hypothetical protein [Planctomycetota bacterium]